MEVRISFVEWDTVPLRIELAATAREATVILEALEEAGKQRNGGMTYRFRNLLGQALSKARQTFESQIE